MQITRRLQLLQNVIQSLSKPTFQLFPITSVKASVSLSADRIKVHVQVCTQSLRTPSCYVAYVLFGMKEHNVRSQRRVPKYGTPPFRGSLLGKYSPGPRHSISFSSSSIPSHSRRWIKRTPTSLPRQGK
jgi:hypothetical protein